MSRILLLLLAILLPRPAPLGTTGVLSYRSAPNIISVTGGRIQNPADNAFTSTDGRFSVVLPEGFGNPELETSTIPSDNGPIKLVMYTSVSRKGGLCMIGYNDFRGIANDSTLKEQILDGAKEGALLNMNATLIDESVLHIDGNPGRSFRFSTQRNSQQLHGQFNYFLVGNRLYQIGYIGAEAEMLASERVIAFFESFRLLEEIPTGTRRKKKR